MLLSLRKNGLTSLFKEVRVFKVTKKVYTPKKPSRCLQGTHLLGIVLQIWVP